MLSKDMLPQTLFGFFWSFIRPKWAAFGSMTFLLLICSFTGAFQPYALKIIIDTVVDTTDNRSLAMQLAIWPILLYAFLNIAQDVTLRIYELIRLRVVPKMKADMRGVMFDYAMNHSYRYFQDQLSGSLSNKILDMVRGFENIIASVFDVFFPITVNMIITTCILWSVHWLLGVFVLIWFILYNAALVFFGRKCMLYSDEQSEVNSRLSGKVVDVFRNMATVRMFARIPYEKKLFSRIQNVEVEKSIKLQKQMWWTHVFQATASIILLILMLVLSVYGWQNQWMTIGDFTLVAQSSLSLVIYSWWMGSQFPLFFKELGVSNQAMTLITAPHEITDANNAQPIKITRGEIRFDDVSFNYVPDHTLFSEKNITIQSGEKLGLVGFSGSGKTTFVNLIQRYFDVEAGQILIDGQDICTVTQQSLREQIATIPQDPMLFHRTLMENIRYGRLDASDEEVIQTAKLAHCHEFIMQLDEGYKSVVGEGGLKLSGGQRQRIAIARAILKNAPILILDEATSALDSVTERKIQQSLQHLMRGKTTLVIAHRLSTLLHMNRILVFKEGQVIESGTHAELLKADGYYAHLWNMQHQGFLPVKESTQPKGDFERFTRTTVLC